MEKGKEMLQYESCENPTGTIKSTRYLSYEEITELKDKEYHYQPDDTEIQDFKDDGYESEELEEFINGYNERIILEDIDPCIYEMVTTDGIFLFVSERIDGHGDLRIFKAL